MKKILLAFTILSIYLHATPITLNDKYNMRLVSLLEKFAPTCSYYSKTIKQPQHIRQQCQKYKRRLDDILRTGYKLDRSIPSMKRTHFYNGKMHTCTAQSRLNMEGSQLYKYYDLVLLKTYTTKLLKLYKLRGQIIEKISLEKTKARKNYEVEYHEKLIRKGVIELYGSDYIFMTEHKEVYANADNPRYIEMLKVYVSADDPRYIKMRNDKIKMVEP